MNGILEIGGLDSVNAAPLQFGLEERAPAGAPPHRLTLRTPAASARALASARAGVALIPSIELQRIPQLSMIPGICIAARRRVQSVVLLTRTDVSRLTEVAVDETSRTSVVLLRILLHRVFGVQPRFVPRAPDAAAMLREFSGALLIADEALRSRVEGCQVHDLAAIWTRWTGLPFVFAVWAARPGVTPEVNELLAASRRLGLENLPRLVAASATRNGNPGGPALTAYLTELLHYGLGTDEESSLARFFAEARDVGEIEEASSLRYLLGPGQALSAGGTP